MDRYRRILFHATIARRAISAVTLAMYSAMVFGLPLPAASRKTAGEAYPCQFSACGCTSAEQCWRSCCCTTPEQRFAWAAAHNVTPPDYAERPQSNGWRTTPRREQESSKKPCCAHEEALHRKPACEHDEPQAPCCSSDSCDPELPDDDAPPQEKKAPAPKAFGFVVGIAAQKCQGLSSLWMTAGQAPPPSAWAEWKPDEILVDCLSFAAISAAVRPTSPALRPPRV